MIKRNNLMKNKFLLKSSAFFIGSLLLFSCGNDMDVDDDGNDNEKDKIIKTDSGIDYSVPTPNALFDIIKINGGKLKMELVNLIENKEKYVDLKSKALNFGVYSADIGYMSCFDYGIEFLKYTKVVESLGDEIGISDVFDKDLMDRIETNEGNSDSLFLISNDTYYESYQYLEDNDKGAELSLIIVGGYIESLYIIVSLVEKYEEGNPLIENIEGQKLVLENIIDFCSTYMDDAGVEEIINDLMNLTDVFEKTMDFVEGESNIQKDGDVVTFTGGGQFKMNENSFNEIKKSVIELRNKITQN